MPLADQIREYGDGTYDWDADPDGANAGSVYVLIADEDGVTSNGVTVMADGSRR